MPRALVIGGSLGGLFAALMLRKIGWDVVVFERVETDLAGRGAGIGTHGELFATMRSIGIEVDSSMAIEVRGRVCLDRAGGVRHRLDLVQYMSAWPRVYGPMRTALPAVCYRPGMRFERFEQDATGVTALFAGGARERGDLLVGADGVRSAVRAQLLPEVEPRYAGYVAWRGIVEEREVRAQDRALFFGTYVFCLPDGELILLYPVPGRDDDVREGHRAVNFVWYRPTEPAHALADLCTDERGHCHGNSIAPPLIRPAVLARLRADARALLAPQIARLVEQAPQPFFQAVLDLESPRIVEGRVVLLGDAAFVARPHVGVGITKAALDARELADALALEPTLEAALARYATARERFGRNIVARARRLGAYLEGQLKPAAERTGAELNQDPVQVLAEMGSRFSDIKELSA